MRKPKITKEAFVKYIQHIRDMDAKEDILASALESIDAEADIAYLSLYSQERRDMIDLLNIAVDAQSDGYETAIEYFIYDLEYGEKYEPGCFIEPDGTDVDLSSAEKLYDYYFPKKDGDNE